MSGPFLTAEWRDLLLVTYAVEPRVLEPRLPAGTVLDRWQGWVPVTLVGVAFEDVRVRGIPVPFHRRFAAVNLRFYVRAADGAGEGRGVVFIKEIVPSRLVGLVARRLYGEPFVAFPTRHVVTASADGDRSAWKVTYEWRVGDRWDRVAAWVRGEPAEPESGSLEEFLAERRFGYSAGRSGRTLRYRLERPRWRIRPAAAVELVCGAEALYGSELARALAGDPVSAFVASGSRVAVYPARSPAPPS